MGFTCRADDHYKWVDMGEEHQLRGNVKGHGWTGYTLNMTSQKWLTDEVFSANSREYIFSQSSTSFYFRMLLS